MSFTFPFNHPPFPCPYACVPVRAALRRRNSLQDRDHDRGAAGGPAGGWVGEWGRPALGGGSCWKEGCEHDGGAPRWPAAPWEVGRRPAPIDNNKPTSGKLLSTQTGTTGLPTSASHRVMICISWTTFRNSVMPFLPETPFFLYPPPHSHRLANWPTPPSSSALAPMTSRSTPLGSVGMMLRCGLVWGIKRGVCLL